MFTHEKIKNESSNQPQDDGISACAISSITDTKIQLILAKYQLIYSIIGIIVGLICILGGIFLFIKGITGEMDWNLKVIGIESIFMNAAPGAILFVVGLFIVIATKFKFEHIDNK